ncbi:EF-hand domain-containing protein [Streptomyces sp. NPDC093568]|uniref:EF-hand domain-containing protein n=1 Tax=Streptomyces sp. NPDC093568 TaxID=3366041 RepID=UPI0037FCFAD8
MTEQATAPMTDAAKQHIFAMLDRDGDGAITHSEYLTRVDRAAAALGRGTDDPVVATARAAHEEVFADMDADHDGRVTFEEYRTWAGHDAFERSCRTALGSLFDVADHDADGRLTREEFTRLRTASGNTEADADQAFDALDTDGDGLIDRDDYLTGIHDYVTTGSSPMAAAYRTLPTP